MAQLQNKDILNAIRDEQSAEYQNNIPVATGLNDLEVYASLEAYPTAKNEFINTLTNRIGRQIFFDKVFNNPFKMLHKGLLPYGKTVEQLFVEMAEEKGFKEHFSGSTSNEGDLIGVVAPKVKADYITQNFEYKFKTSISDLQLKGAFTNQFGLMNLINKAVNSLLSSSQYSEFRDMKKILTNKTADSTGGSKIGTGLVQKMYADSNTKANSFFPVGSKIDGKTVAKGAGFGIGIGDTIGGAIPNTTTRIDHFNYDVGQIKKTQDEAQKKINAARRDEEVYKSVTKSLKKANDSGFMKNRTSQDRAKAVKNLQEMAKKKIDASNM